ncbi:hypothetical protein AB835_03095 [Candidatus Endobugula sertula]|uniref:GspL cytoplasmic actin-ATPase-like domain-containing protein n=1 Tax=Candidatus Endobugula sertula TaxID=62101 RepID=A0A1D2QSL7_9GAMM|nr:hypothetical protein AB835_03095 [Candidatus Endobugula sertula]
MLSPCQTDDQTNVHGSAIYQWGMANTELMEENAQQGNQDQLMEWLERQTQAIVLVIPGEKAVVCQVDFNEKERRHFDKMLPYEVEDNIIGDVDELHFAVGLKQTSQATVAYIDKEWFAKQWNFFVGQGIDVSHCFVQFQLIHAEENETVCWFSGEMLHVHRANGLGFSCARTVAPILLKNFLQNIDAEYTLSVYMDYAPNDKEGVSIVNLLHTLVPEMESKFFQGTPELSINHPQAINFCCGQYKSHMSGGQWFKEFSGIAGLATVALIAFLSVNFFDIYQLKQQNQQKHQRIEAAYRTVIPQGVMNDPIK